MLAVGCTHAHRQAQAQTWDAATEADLPTYLPASLHISCTFPTPGTGVVRGRNDCLLTRAPSVRGFRLAAVVIVVP